MAKATKKTDGGKFVKGVVTNYENYKAPKTKTGPAPAMKKGVIVKSKKK